MCTYPKSLLEPASGLPAGSPVVTMEMLSLSATANPTLEMETTNKMNKLDTFILEEFTDESPEELNIMRRAESSSARRGKLKRAGIAHYSSEVLENS